MLLPSECCSDAVPNSISRTVSAIFPTTHQGSQSVVHTTHAHEVTPCCTCLTGSLAVPPEAIAAAVFVSSQSCRLVVALLAVIYARSVWGAVPHIYKFAGGELASQTVAGDDAPCRPQECHHSLFCRPPL